MRWKDSVNVLRFTEFRLPNAERRAVVLDLDEQTTKLGKELVAAGYSFEIEVLRDGMINMDCCDSEEPLDTQLAPAGASEDVLLAVARELVANAHQAWVAAQRPKGIGRRGAWVQAQEVLFKLPLGGPADEPAGQMYDSTKEEELF